MGADRRSVTFDSHRYFFDDGIRFSCRRCGACCTGEPGIISVDPTEIARIAAFLGLPLEGFQRDHVVATVQGPSLRERPDGRCHFYEKGCRIYPVRPTQCRTWPFWVENLRNPRRWAAVCRECPGIGTGRSYTREEILDRLADGRPDRGCDR